MNRFFVVEAVMANHEIRIERSLPLGKEPGTGHNRWHPDIRPLVTCKPGDEVEMATRDAFDRGEGVQADLGVRRADAKDLSAHLLYGAAAIAASAALTRPRQR
jgi:formamidase